MSPRDAFDDALDDAIDALSAGRPLERVLSDHPGHAATLRPLLETVIAATVAAAHALPAPRLSEHIRMQHLAAVQGAVQRARMATPLPVRDAQPERAWWQRRLTSLSLPVGAIVLMVLGAGGAAAAATVAVTDAQLPSVVTNIGAPDWAQRLTPGGSGGHGGMPNGDGTPAAGAGASATATRNDNGPLLLTVSGTVSDLGGNTFTLTNVDGAWHVQIDSNTAVDGVIADGAEASVSGDVTAEKNLHATDVEVTAAAPAPDDDPKPEKTPPAADKTPSSPDSTPGPPEQTPKPERTPPANADRTPPGGPPEQPPAPPGGQGSGTGNSDGAPGNQGNGGGPNPP